MHFLEVNEKPTNALIIQCTDTQHSHTCFDTLECHHQGAQHDAAETGVMRSKDGWKLYIVTGGVMVGIIPTITPPVTISFHPSLLLMTPI
jgi:hypothetical protein